MATLSDVINNAPKVQENKRQEKKEPLEEKRTLPNNKRNNFVLCRSRPLGLDELILLNRMFSVLEFKTEYHYEKEASELCFECLILDFHDKKHLTWFMKNKKYLSEYNQIINLALQKKSLKYDNIKQLKEQYNFDSVIKKIEKLESPAKLLSHMLIDHIPMPQNSCLDGCFRLLQNQKKTR